MTYFARKIHGSVQAALNRGKSVLLLGPRQTGKTTFIQQQVKPDIAYSFANVKTRLRFEKDISLLVDELEYKLSHANVPPVVFFDEIQKLPMVMDIAQDFIDRKKAQFILTGSSAKKLKHGSNINLLPGRVVSLVMDPFSIDELEAIGKIEPLLLYGSLPGILTEKDDEAKEIDLQSYVSEYLEEEVRLESLVRNLGNFSRFLELAAAEAGRAINYTKLSQQIGIADTTISHYFQILEDCLIIFRIDPLSKGKSTRRLMRRNKYLFFDLGIRRVCANEGVRLPQKTLGDLFEQFIGIELIRKSHLASANTKILYWRDANGPEVDFVLDIEKRYIPIEVKWSTRPTMQDARHLHGFLQDYSEASHAYIISRAEHPYRLADNITVLPWRNLLDVFE